MNKAKRLSLKRLRMPFWIALALPSCYSPSSIGCEFDAEHLYRITATKLSESLLVIGRVSGCTVVFEPKSTREQMNPPIIGRLTVREAMQRALVRSDLETVQTHNGTLTVRRRAAGSQKLAEQ